MGISRLAELIREEAPDALRSVPLGQYRDCVMALDASVAIYQFRTGMPELYNRQGQNISPLQGLFYRTLHLLENGIKPVFVFDGRPPERKQPVLAKRAAVSGTKREAPDSAPGDAPQPPPKRDLETLLNHLGVPHVQAPAEAEATCAALVKSGVAWCTATEDMDALPFGSLRLLRHLHVKSRDLEEVSLPVVLQKLGMTQEQFVDLCILLGCDYCGKIRGLGPKKALKLLKQHGCIEQLLQHIDPQKHPLPANWHLEETRRLFLQPEVADPSQVVLEWREPDEEGLVRFLAHEKHINESRIRRRMEKWREAILKQTQPQLPGAGTKRRPKKQKITDFFQVKKRQEDKTGDAQPCQKRRKSSAGVSRELQDSAGGDGQDPPRTSKTSCPDPREQPTGTVPVVL